MRGSQHSKYEIIQNLHSTNYNTIQCAQLTFSPISCTISSVGQTIIWKAGYACNLTSTNDRLFLVRTGVPQDSVISLFISFYIGDNISPRLNCPVYLWMASLLWFYLWIVSLLRFYLWMVSLLWFYLWIVSLLWFYLWMVSLLWFYLWIVSLLWFYLWRVGRLFSSDSHQSHVLRPLPYYLNSLPVAI